jgi:hypothetical protein
MSHSPSNQAAILAAATATVAALSTVSTVPADPEAKTALPPMRKKYATSAAAALQACRLWPVHANTTQLHLGRHQASISAAPLTAQRRDAIGRPSCGPVVESALAIERHDLFVQLSTESKTTPCQCAEAFQDYLDVLQKGLPGFVRSTGKARARYCDRFLLDAPAHATQEDPPSSAAENDATAALPITPPFHLLQPVDGLALRDHGCAAHRPAAIPRLVSLYGGTDQNKWALVELRMDVQERREPVAYRMVEILPRVFTGVTVHPHPPRCMHATVYAILPPRDAVHRTDPTVVLGYAHPADTTGMPTEPATLLEWTLPPPQQYNGNDPLQVLWLGHLHAFAAHRQRIPRTTQLCMNVLRTLSPIDLLPWHRIALRMEWRLVRLDSSRAPLTEALTDKVAESLQPLSQLTIADGSAH